MKVTGPGKSGKVSKTSKSTKTNKSDGAGFGDFMNAGVESAKEGAAASSTQSIAKVDALLAVQAAEDSTQRQKKTKLQKRAEDLLEELEKIRMAMLNGSLTIGHMIDIADVVAEHREKVDDPHLTSIMDEIDLRAQVEIAKMRVAVDALQ